MENENEKEKEKNLEYMTDHQLLIELVKSQKKDTFHEKVSSIANVILVIVILVVVLAFSGKAFSTLKNMDALISGTNDLVVTAQDSLGDIDKMVANVNTLVEDNTESLNTSLQKLSEIDIESLNDSIRSLKAVAEPLEQFFSIFSK